MTNELEKQFFDAFEIEPRLDCKRCGAKNFALGQCWEVNCEKSYPQITDRILLELICIGTQFFAELVLLTSDNIEDLKEQVLTIYLKTAYKDKLKHQVRTLFEEG